MVTKIFKLKLFNTLIILLLSFVLQFLSVKEARAARLDPATLRLVVKTRVPYEGNTGTRILEGFNWPQVDTKGQVTFDAYYNNSIDGLTAKGIWSERTNGVLTEVVHSGDSHPGLSPYGFLIANVNTPQSNQGTIAFLDEILGDLDGPRRGVWIGLPNQELKLVAVNKPISGTDAFVVLDGGNDLAVLNVSPKGHAVLRTSTARIYLADPGSSVRLLAEETMPAAGTNGELFRSFTETHLNDRGDVSWAATLSSSGINSQFGIWKELSPSSHEIVVQAGDIATGTPSVPFHQFLSHTIDNSGNVSFSSWLFTSDKSMDVGVWAERNGQGILPVLVEGDRAPGTDTDVIFADMDRNFPDPAYGESGDIAIRARIAGPGVNIDNDSGIWAFDGDDLSLVVREGDAAPGTEPGVVFDHFYSGANMGVNYQGQVGFTGVLKGPGVVSNQNSIGIWAQDEMGDLQLIARQGDLFTDGMDGDFTLNGITFNPLGFGKNGHIAFNSSIRGTNQKAMFVSSIVAVEVPEPSGILLSTVGLVGVLLMRRTIPFYLLRPYDKKISSTT